MLPPGVPYCPNTLCGVETSVAVGNFSGDTDTGGELGICASYIIRLLYAVGLRTGAGKSFGIADICRALTSCASRLS